MAVCGTLVWLDLAKPNRGGSRSNARFSSLLCPFIPRANALVAIQPANLSEQAGTV